MMDRIEALKELERKAKGIADPAFRIMSPEFVHREVVKLAEALGDLTRIIIEQEGR